MKIITKGTMPDGTSIQIEEWHGNYDFLPYAATIAAYPISKWNHPGPFAPKAGEKYRFQFDFKNEESARNAFDKLIGGEAKLSDYVNNLNRQEYANCL